MCWGQGVGRREEEGSLWILRTWHEGGAQVFDWIKISFFQEQAGRAGIWLTTTISLCFS